MKLDRNELISLLDSIEYNTELFKDGNNRIGFTYIDMKKRTNDKWEYKAVYDSILDIDQKIKKSLYLALELLDNNHGVEFNPVAVNSENDKEIYYYIENAVFRISILWNLLAHFYDVRYNLVNNPKKIDYKKFFKIKCKELDNVINIDEILKYIKPKNGTHHQVNEYRNKLTHRYSPNITQFITSTIVLRENPEVLLGYTIKDYHKLTTFIRCFLDNIETK